MMHKAWSSIEEMPYCFSRSYLKLQGHTAKKMVDFDPNWAFPVCNSSLNSPMAIKCCTKLETTKERCPIVFQGHPSNFKVTRYKTSPILTQIGRFRTIGRSQLSNPSDLPCFHKFASKISDVFFKVQHSFGHILRKVCPIDVKRKGGASVGYWVNYVTLTFDLIHDLDPWFFKVKFQNSFISGIVIWLMWNKKKENEIDTVLTVWSCPLTTPMTDLVVSSFLFEEWEWGADWHGTKGIWFNHSWLWPWPMSNHGGVGGCTVYWLGWLLSSDVCVPSTYLVQVLEILCNNHLHDSCH